MGTKLGMLACALVLVACGGESDGAEPSPEAAGSAPSVIVTAPAAPEPAAGDLVVRDSQGDTVRIGPGGRVVEAEEAETGETATVAQADGTTTVQGGNGEQVVTDGEETQAREGGDTATVRRDGVVASDGENQVVIRRDGRGVSIGGLQLGR